MSVTAAFCPLSVQTLFDQNACPVRGGNLYFYDAGTTTARATYRDSALTQPYPTPVKTNGFGRIPPIFLDVGDYKVVVQDANGALIDTIDNLPGGTQDVDPTPVASSGFKTGDYKECHTDTDEDGWLPANGETIGNASSVATSRANDDCQALFIELWNKDPTLVVSGAGRGISASADWNAAKTIALPKRQGRVGVPVDQMGAAATAGVITSATTATPDQIGTLIGSETVTLDSTTVPSSVTTTVSGSALTVAQLPTFTPTINITDPGHDHGYTDPGHFHTIGISQQSTPGSGGPTSAQQGTGSSNTLNATTNITILTHLTNISATSNPIGSGQTHTHDATSTLGGTAAAHTNMQPGMLVYVKIKL